MAPARGYMPDGKFHVAGFYTCDNCASPSIAISEATMKMYQGQGQALRILGQEDALSWLPATAEGHEFPDVPDHIAAAADEAYRCRSINALRASVLLARGVIEAGCKHKGITSGRLAAKIDKMKDDGHLRTHTQQMAHEIRYMGNDMAHGDFITEVDTEAADEMLDLMSEFLNEVFQGPARVARITARRTGSTE